MSAPELPAGVAIGLDDRLAEELADAVGPHLGRQRWFAGPAPVSARLDAVERLDVGPPELVRLEASVPDEQVFPSDRVPERRRYQLVVALRPASEAPDVPPDAVLARFHAGTGPVQAHDALADPEARLRLLEVVVPGARAARSRPLGVEQTNSSVVYDERLLLKLYRRLLRGPNPEVEVATALATAGNAPVLAPVAAWRRHGVDLAVVQRFLADGEEGWALALASLSSAPSAGTSSGFVAEARRLGEVTAALHLALARAFGTADADAGGWADAMTSSLAALAPEDRAAARGAEEVFDRLRSLADAGRAIRVHGDYHLGQVVRTPEGWFVLDFEGEPERPLEERRRPTSPLKDVAGMLRSFGYAAAVAGADDGVWETRCRAAFSAGYFATPGVEALLPAEPAARGLVADAFELDKAVYELGYERAHRPGWARIPLAAIARLTAR